RIFRKGTDQTEQSLVEHTYGAQEQLEGQILESVALVVPYENDRVEVVDREEARKLAERLYKLEDVQRTDVVRHLDKDNEFSRAVGEEYLKFFDFTDQSLDEALRSFLKEVVLIGESQERERVLERFSIRYQQCNPHSFSLPESVLTLTCAVMLLNTDLHGQNVGKAMSLTDFVSNLDGMNEGENFNKDLLKTLYHSIKNHPLEWAVEEKELVKSMILEQDSEPDGSLRSKSNPFQDIAHDKKATVFQKGFLKRKAHADIDGKRIPWGKRSWKTFYAVLKGMVLYLQKDEYRKDWQSSEEVLSVHHALAEKAEDYTKRPHVFRLQTADWRVFLFEAASTEQMNSWIGRINLVSALYSSPPFPAAVGSQRKFCRPILPATQSALTLEKQLQSHAAMLQSFQEDLSALQQGAPEGRKAKARELEEYRLREEYLQHERCRYEAYVQILEVWQRLGNSSVDGGMKRSHSSPSLELEVAAPPVVKVRRNISERRTYRKIVIPRRNREV
uniref:Pleckstrin and Sec7 domain containing 4 n=1 Tax=Pygocentrus nattereri TaxID=42514 RepID=A0AAR2K7K8_PYGNA